MRMTIVSVIELPSRQLLHNPLDPRVLTKEELMSHTLARITALGAAAATVLVVSGGAASAAPACSDAVAGVLHTAHAATGDPAGVIHEAEETYCSVG